MHVYVSTDERDDDGNRLWAVGFYTPTGKWVPVAGPFLQDDAGRLVNYLNGGTGDGISS